MFGITLILATAIAPAIEAKPALKAKGPSPAYQQAMRQELARRKRKEAAKRQAVQIQRDRAKYGPNADRMSPEAKAEIDRRRAAIAGRANDSRYVRSYRPYVPRSR